MRRQGIRWDPRGRRSEDWGVECKTERTAGDGDWYLWQVSGRIVVSGEGADEVRFTGSKLAGCTTTGMTEKRRKDRNRWKKLFCYLVSIVRT